MRIVLLLSFISVSAAFTDLPSDLAFYDTFLKNSTAVKLHIGCILDMNPCDDFGSHSKKHFADALKGHHVNCDGCDAVQKHVAHIMDQLINQEEYKVYYDEFKRRYDPEGKFLAELEDSVKDY